MKTNESNVGTPKPNAEGSLWLQMAAILAGAVALGFLFNSVSPLGVRVQHADPVTEIPRVQAGPAGNLPSHVILGAVSSQLSQNAAASNPATQVPAGTNSGATAATAATQPVIRTLTWAQVKPRLQENRIVLVDARMKENYNLGHIPGAILFSALSTAEEFQAFAAKYPKDTTFVVYCGSDACHVSRQLAEMFVKICGYTNVFDMPGGYAGFLAAEPQPARDGK